MLDSETSLSTKLDASKITQSGMGSSSATAAKPMTKSAISSSSSHAMEATKSAASSGWDDVEADAGDWSNDKWEALDEGWSDETCFSY